MNLCISLRWSSRPLSDVCSRLNLYDEDSSQKNNLDFKHALINPNFKHRRTEAMTTAIAKNAANTVNKNSNTLPSPTLKSYKQRLVAHWLVDENLKRYCQWVVED